MFNDAEGRSDLFKIKVILLLILNVVLADFDVLETTQDFVVFNIGALLFWLGLYLLSVQRIYESNLSRLPTISNSVPVWDEVRRQHEIDRKAALSAAVQGHEWSQSDMQW